MCLSQEPLVLNVQLIQVQQATSDHGFKSVLTLLLDSIVSCDKLSLIFTDIIFHSLLYGDNEYTHRAGAFIQDEGIIDLRIWPYSYS